jgi:SOS-response transcriptional repressor LexA
MDVMHAGNARRQMRLLKFLKRYRGRHGFGPTFEEMRVALGLSTKSHVFYLVRQLEDRGLIQCQRKGAGPQTKRRIKPVTMVKCPNCGAAVDVGTF